MDGAGWCSSGNQSGGLRRSSISLGVYFFVLPGTVFGPGRLGRQRASLTGNAHAGSRPAATAAPSPAPAVGAVTAAIIDEEVKKLLSTAHQEAFDTLEKNRDVLDSLVLQLLDKETLDKAEIAEIFIPLRLHPDRPAWTGSDARIPSTIPPVEIPQEIRDRAAAGALAQKEEGAVILTPPGAGGDTHGDVPGDYTPPEPPHSA